MFDSVSEVLDFAIGMEETSESLYLEMSKKVNDPLYKVLYEDFAEEEAGHKKKLLTMKEKGQFKPLPDELKKIRDLEFPEEINPEDMSYRDILNLAINKEKSSLDLYKALAKTVEGGEIKKTFMELAKEELKHRLRFEKELKSFKKRFS